MRTRACPCMYRLAGVLGALGHAVARVRVPKAPRHVDPAFCVGARVCVRVCVCVCGCGWVHVCVGVGVGG